MLDVDQHVAQKGFVERLPHIERIAGRAFRSLPQGARQDAVAEVVALCWQNYLQCLASNKEVQARSMAYYAILSVKGGGALCNSSSTDVLARRTQLLARATVYSLPCTDTPPDGADLSEALVDKRIWERPLERTRLKLDYTQFLAQVQITAQERAVFNLLAKRWRTGEIARRLGVSAPRVCQVKNALARKLVAFFGVTVS